MPWSGTGTFSRTDGTRTGTTVWQQAKAALVKIVAADHDTHDQDLATGINNCLTKDGQNSPTADIDWGGFKITNLDSSSDPSDAARRDETVTGILTVTGNIVQQGASGPEEVTPGSVVALLMRGYIAGLKLTNNTTDANNDIDIAAGVATADDQSDVLVLSSGVTKRLDAAWAAGTGGGGLDTGSKANSTWYYVWLIRRSDTGVVDVLFSTSSTSPTMPSGYDQKRRIGAIRTNASGNILAFRQIGDLFRWVTPIEDIDVTSFAGPTNFTLTVPPIPGVQAQLLGAFANTTAGTELYIEHPSETQTNGAITGRTQVTGVGASWGVAVVPTSDTGQVKVGTSQANSTVSIYTRGYIDPRGRND